MTGIAVRVKVVVVVWKVVCLCVVVTVVVVGPVCMMVTGLVVREGFGDGVVGGGSWENVM